MLSIPKIFSVKKLNIAKTVKIQYSKTKSVSKFYNPFTSNIKQKINRKLCQPLAICHNEMVTSESVRHPTASLCFLVSY